MSIHDCITCGDRHSQSTYGYETPAGEEILYPLDVSQMAPGVTAMMCNVCILTLSHRKVANDVIDDPGEPWEDKRACAKCFEPHPGPEDVWFPGFARAGHPFKPGWFAFCEGCLDELLHDTRGEFKSMSPKQAEAYQLGEFDIDESSTVHWPATPDDDGSAVGFPSVYGKPVAPDENPVVRWDRRGSIVDGTVDANLRLLDVRDPADREEARDRIISEATDDEVRDAYLGLLDAVEAYYEPVVAHLDGDTIPETLFVE